MDGGKNNSSGGGQRTWTGQRGTSIDHHIPIVFNENGTKTHLQRVIGGET